MTIYRLPKQTIFPHPDEAEPNGLLAVGGDLSAERLINAYAQGIFPWYNQGDPILWWSPNPRMVMFPNKFKRSKSFIQTLRKTNYELRIDSQFEWVIDHCAGIERKGADGTWITNKMLEAYKDLHKLGIAHSFETWRNGKLVGGLYGLSLGKAFFGESMFHVERDASKFAFFQLTQWCIENEFHFIDCQMPTTHLASLGAEEIPRSQFLDLLYDAITEDTLQGNWSDTL